MQATSGNTEVTNICKLPFTNGWSNKTKHTSTRRVSCFPHLASP